MSKSNVTIEHIRSIVEAAGATLISNAYVNNHAKIEFLCSSCGSPATFTWKGYNKGQNRKFRCSACNKQWLKQHLRELKQGYTIEQLREEFANKGAELISTEYTNDRQALWFKCSNCGNPWHITMSVYKRGDNNALLCQTCYLKNQGKRKITYSELKQFFEDNGSELYSKEFKSIRQVLDFKCKHCGEVAHYSYEAIMQRTGDRKFYCCDCLKGFILNPTGIYGTGTHHLYDMYWFEYIYTFYNLTEEQKKIYSAHHIKRFSIFPEYRTSFCNGYPINIKYHDLGSVDPVTGLINPFHVVDGYLQASDFPDYVKLPYHTYSDFKFLNLNDKMITEIVAPFEDQEKDFLIEKYEHFAAKDVLYIPFFFDELFIERRLQIVCSLVRRLLFKWFPDIYLYTGQDFYIYNAFNLDLDTLTFEQAKEFYKLNSLCGVIHADNYLGYYDRNDLVMVLAYNINDSHCDILGCTEKLNSIVESGLKIILQYLIESNSLKTIQYKQDFRFPLYQDDLNFFGFQYKGKTEPNLFYMNRDTNRLFKDNCKMAQDLNIRVDLGMSLVEKEKCGESYVRVYDLGDSIYGWQKD